jgi:hypothetical protein
VRRLICKFAQYAAASVLPAAPLLLPFHFAPSVAWLAQALRTHAQGGVVQLATGGLYRKQMGWNRAYLKGANKVELLSVPLVHAGLNTPWREVRISYATHWRLLHRRTIEAALRRSPFFDHFAPDVFAQLDKQYTFLLDLNRAVLDAWGKALGLRWHIAETGDAWTENDPQQWQPGTHPAVPYFQQFGEFVPNLSALDVLCNEGPRVIHILS